VGSSRILAMLAVAAVVSPAATITFIGFETVNGSVPVHCVDSLNSGTPCTILGVTSADSTSEPFLNTPFGAIGGDFFSINLGPGVYFLYATSFLDDDRLAGLPLHVVVNDSDLNSESPVFTIPDLSTTQPFTPIGPAPVGFSLAATGIQDVDRVGNAGVSGQLGPDFIPDDVVKLTIGAPSAAVPEPGPWALLLTGLGVIVAVRVRTAFHRRKTS
jgi:hypothetical protein